MLLLWSFFITFIPVIYLVLSLVLHFEERKYALRQQQLLERWREAFPPTPPLPRPEEPYRDLEQSPLIHNFEEGDATEDESYTHGGGGGGGYGATDSHPNFIPVPIYTDHEVDDHPIYVAAGPVPSSPFSPGTPDNSYGSSIDTLAELPPDHGDHAVSAAGPRSPSLREKLDPSGDTDRGMAWEHVESVAGSGSGLAEEAAAAAEDAVAAEVATETPADLGHVQRPEEVVSVPRPPKSPDVLGGHEVMAKIKKAVHWHPSLKGESSTSSSSCSSPKSSQQDGPPDGLRKRGNQE